MRNVNETLELNDEVRSVEPDPVRPFRSVDALRRTFGVVSGSWFIIVVCGLVAGIAVLSWSLTRTPEYSSTATLYVTSGSDSGVQSAYQGSLASQQRVTSYTELVSSDAVLKNAIDAAHLDISTDKAKSLISATSKPNTVLLYVSARDSDPSRATLFANAVANSLASYVSELEKPAEGGVPLAKLTVVTPAVQENKPVSPRTGRDVLFGVIGGFVLGLFIVFVRERLDNTVRSDLEFSSDFGVSVLAAIPHDARLKANALVDFSGGAMRSAEAYRRLRTGLSFVGVDSPSRIIMVVSPNPGDGKTTTAINLAGALAEMKSRVLLVDSDLRRPMVAESLGLNSGVGLSDCLRSGDLQLSSAIQWSARGELNVLTSGSQPPNPAELLGSNRAGALFGELAKEFDYVIVDTSPLLPVADAEVLSRWVDGVVVVVKNRVTPRSDLAESLLRMQRSCARVLGLVINSDDAGGRGYGSGAGKYYDGGL